MAKVTFMADDAKVKSAGDKAVAFTQAYEH